MRGYSGRAGRLDIATAFITTDAALNVLRPAIDSGARIRLLTGTFGRNTREETFRRLLRLSRDSRLSVRIWQWGGNRNLHVKLYVWTMRSGEQVAWVGSANLTRGGVTNEGELILELSARKDSGAARQLQSAFEREWTRGTRLDANFIASYEESPRPAADARVARHRIGRPSPVGRKVRREPFFTADIYSHYPTDSPAARRIESILSGTADDWFTTASRRVGRAAVGDIGVLVDHEDREGALIQVVENKRYGKRHVLAFLPVIRRNGWIDWSPAVAKRAATALATSRRGRSLGSRTLNRSRFRELVSAVYGRRRLPAAVRTRLRSAP